MTGLIQSGIDRCCGRSPGFEWSGPLRKLRFLVVGTFCFILQYGLLRALSGAGVTQVLANGVGFVVSAQANFVLSLVFTWSDRTHGHVPASSISKRHLNVNRIRWLSYNGTAAIALAVNTVVFAAADRVVGALPAALAGVAAGTVVTFLVCDRLIFAGRAPAPSATSDVAEPTEATWATEVTPVSPITDAVESLWEGVS
jgi:putative flippase GtrA